MTRNRTAMVSTGLGLLVLAQASPAVAAEHSPGEHSPGLHWAPSSNADGQVQDDARLSGIVQLGADVSTDQPVKGWSLSLVSDAQQPAFGAFCQHSFRRPQDTFRVDCRWDTARFPDGRPSANQRYLVRLSTHQDEADRPAGPDRPVALVNPAVAPSDVVLAYDRANRHVALTWAANQEPDVAHYDVEENVDGKGWTTVGEPTDTTFGRTVTEAGDHQYRVAAERRGPDGKPGVPGRWANPKPSSDKVQVSPDDPRPASSQPDGGNARQAAGAPPPASGTASAQDPSPAPAPTAPTGPEAPAASAADTSPTPEHSSLVFSPSSADAFASLHDQPAPPALPAGGKAPVPPAAARPSVVEEPDTGFEAKLPHPPRQGDSGSESGSGPTIASEPDDRQVAAPVVHGGRTRGHSHRPQGAGLIVVAAGLLATAIRPIPRKRSRRPGAPSPAIPERRGPLPSAEGDASRIAALEARLAHLESLLASRPWSPGTTGPSTSDEIWYAELF